MKSINTRSGVFLISYAIFLYFLVQNFQLIFAMIRNVAVLLSPFVTGFAIAYLLNRPFVFFQERLFGALKNAKNPKTKKMVVPLALISTYLLVFGVIAFLLMIITPQLILSVNQLISNFSQYISSVENFAYYLINTLGISSSVIEHIKNSIVQFLQNFDQFVNTIFPHLFNFTKSFTSGIYNWVIGLVVSIYFLSNKKTLLKQLKKLLRAVVSKDWNDRIMEIAELTDSKFGKYIVGQLMDAFVIGVLCFVGMSALGIPYATLISVIVGVTNVIPFFGPFIGAIPSIFILLIVDPIKALFFALFILILQQIDGNIIGPKIIGGSIGISGLWIMFSVLIGGGLFGAVGMVIGVPVFAVIYHTISKWVNRRLKERGV